MAADDPISAELASLLHDKDRSVMKLRTLLGRLELGLDAAAIRAFSREVVPRLEALGVRVSFPSGERLDARVVLERVQPCAGAMPSPLEFAFELESARAGQRIEDVEAAIWAGERVCVGVAGHEGAVALLVGHLAALLRACGVTGHEGGLRVTSVDELEALAAHRADSVEARVLIQKMERTDHRALSALQRVRERAIPQSFVLRARYASDLEALRSPAWPSFRGWLATLASDSGFAKELVVDPTHPPRLATLLAEAEQTRRCLERRSLNGEHDRDLSVLDGESDEHLLLRRVACAAAEERYCDEEFVLGDGSVDARAGDIVVGDKAWIEVETLRDASEVQSASLFLALEHALVCKETRMRKCAEVWLVVPADLACLAFAQLAAVARHLEQQLCTSRRKRKVRLACADLAGEDLVFLDTAPTPTEPIIASGQAWQSEPAAEAKPAAPIRLASVAGYTELKTRVIESVLEPLQQAEVYARHGLPSPRGLLLYGLPGCGKSLMGRALAGELGWVTSLLRPSDLTSKWLGEGVEKIRALFDWALAQERCLLVIDELDAVASVRSLDHMHEDTRREVGELLNQLDRIAGREVLVVATSNFAHGIDPAIRRSGRFDLKLPVFPPDAADREAILRHHLQPKAGAALRGLDDLDLRALAARLHLYVPADLEALAIAAKRRAVRRDPAAPRLLEIDLERERARFTRSLTPAQARAWVEEVRGEIGPSSELARLEEDAKRAEAESAQGRRGALG